jgi:hypothetical protein
VKKMAFRLPERVWVDCFHEDGVEMRNPYSESVYVWSLSEAALDGEEMASVADVARMDDVTDW